MTLNFGINPISTGASLSVKGTEALSALSHFQQAQLTTEALPNYFEPSLSQKASIRSGADTHLFKQVINVNRISEFLELVNTNRETPFLEAQACLEYLATKVYLPLIKEQQTTAEFPIDLSKLAKEPFMPRIQLLQKKEKTFLI
jgi:hypothetical protein